MNSKSNRTIAFYAPLKSPLHSQPSGDRLIARLLFKALQTAGYDVRLVSEFRSFDPTGDATRQERMIRLGKKLAERLIRRWQREDFQPDIWFCYHNYYKAPDLLGPTVCETLNIPYWTAEASWANKRAHGPWHHYHSALQHCLHLAQGVVVLNPVDKAALQKVLRPDAKFLQLPVFLDTQLFTQWLNPPKNHSALVPPKLVTVAMLRPGDKLHSLVILAHALKKLQSNFHLHIIGDGKARRRAQSLFLGLPVTFEGQLEGEQLWQFVSQCDLFIWPAVNEAIGMAVLEAQACGTPVLVGREGGTHSVVKHGVTGELTPPRDPAAFSCALQRLLDHPATLHGYRKNTTAYVQTTHSLNNAARQLKQALN